jgi:hypothetical protein
MQSNLQSSLFEQTDHSQHATMERPKYDINNLKDDRRKADHMYSDIMTSGEKVNRQGGLKKADDLGHATGDWQTPDVKSQIKKDYTNYGAKTQKSGQLKSSLDTHTFEPSPTKALANQTPEKHVHIPGKSSRATKVRDLASDIHGTGESAL